MRCATLTTSSYGTPNLAVFSPVLVYGCVSVATSGLTRIPREARRLRRLGRAELRVRKHTYRRSRLLFDLRLARVRAAVPGVGEATRALHELEELLLGHAPHGVGLAPLARRREERGLDIVEHGGHG